MRNFKQFCLRFKAYAKPWERREAGIKRLLDKIWQGTCEVRRDYDWIPLYFQFRQPDEANTVDDRTWSDLEMDEVFSRIDRTTSVIGRQYLYALLRIYDNDDLGLEKQKRTALYSLFRTKNDSLSPRNGFNFPDTILYFLTRRDRSKNQKMGVRYSNGTSGKPAPDLAWYSNAMLFHVGID